MKGIMTGKTRTSRGDFDPDMTMHQDDRPFDVQEQSGRRAMILLIAAAGFLLVLALIVFNIYQPGIRDRAAPPTISADNTPFKIKPENPGGEVTPHQNKEIYKVMDGQSVESEVTTVRSAEVPIEIPKSANVIVRAPEPVNVPSREMATGKEPRIASSPARTISPPKRVEAANANASLYVVQVASVRSRVAAEDIWTKIEKEFDPILSDRIFADIKEADLGDKGIYYRLRLAGLADKASAARLCERLVARNQACFVTRK